VDFPSLPSIYLHLYPLSKPLKRVWIRMKSPNCLERCFIREVVMFFEELSKSQLNKGVAMWKHRWRRPKVYKGRLGWAWIEFLCVFEGPFLIWDEVLHKKFIKNSFYRKVNQGWTKPLKMAEKITDSFGFSLSSEDIAKVFSPSVRKKMGLQRGGDLIYQKLKVCLIKGDFRKDW